MIIVRLNGQFGEVTEWLKVPVLKTGVPAMVPRVRIPPSPPEFFMSKPFFSIVVPAYNEEDYIGACLESLQNQDFKQPYEIIVVNNNSQDNTELIAKNFNVKVVNELARGVCNARQAGLDIAKASIIISTDADTTFPTDWLSRIAKSFKENPKAVAVAGSPCFTDAPLWGRVTVWIGIAAVKIYKKIFKKPCYICAANLAFKKSAFKKYNTKLTQGGDELYVLKELNKQGDVILDLNNYVYTSSRRLYRGFFYNFFVTAITYYFLDYQLAKITGKSIFGSYPAFRNRADALLKKRNTHVLMMLVITFSMAVTLWLSLTRISFLERQVERIRHHSFQTINPSQNNHR